MSEEKIIETLPVEEEANELLNTSTEVMSGSNINVALTGGVIGALLMYAGIKTWSWIKKKREAISVDSEVVEESEEEMPEE